MGVGKYLKEYNPKIKIVCAHPVKGHYIQGLKNMEEAIVPSIYDPSMIDMEVMIKSEDAFEMTRELARKEGIFAGMSSGAAMLAAADTAKNANSGVIIVIFPDRGDRYLTTDLF
jgi:cysteine synthase B